MDTPKLDAVIETCPNRLYRKAANKELAALKAKVTRVMDALSSITEFCNNKFQNSDGTCSVCNGPENHEKDCPIHKAQAALDDEL